MNFRVPRTTCSVEGCDRPSRRQRRRLCGTHEARLRLHGDVNYSYKSEAARLERFWADVDKTAGQGPWGDCWLWTGRLDPDGYGACKSRKPGTNRVWRAHQWSFVQAGGEISDGLVVRHTCDVRRCVNPSHLLVGTPAENTADMVERGRHLIGEEKPQAKLNSVQVKEIKRRIRNGEKKAPLSREFNVSGGTIYSLADGRTWTHIN